MFSGVHSEKFLNIRSAFVRNTSLKKYMPASTAIATPIATASFDAPRTQVAVRIRGSSITSADGERPGDERTDATASRVERVPPRRADGGGFAAENGVRRRTGEDCKEL